MQICIHTHSLHIHCKGPFTSSVNLNANVNATTLAGDTALIQNGLQTSSQMTPLFSMRAVSPASSQRWHHSEADACCKWTLNLYFTVTPVLMCKGLFTLSDNVRSKVWVNLHGANAKEHCEELLWRPREKRSQKWSRQPSINITRQYWSSRPGPDRGWSRYR